MRKRLSNREEESGTPKCPKALLAVPYADCHSRPEYPNRSSTSAIRGRS